MDPQQLAQMMSRMGLSPEDLVGMMPQSNVNTSANGQVSMEDFLRGISAPRRSGAAVPRDGPPSLSFSSSPEEIVAYKGWLEKDNKKPPELGPVTPRTSLLVSQEMGRRKQEAEERTPGTIQTRFTIIGFPKHSCMLQLKELKPIKCYEMLMRKSHLGSYLLCRSIAPWTSVVAIQTIIEDINGDARLLSIYNFPTANGGKLSYIDLLFPLGVTMAILEPTYKAATQGPNAMIRVDSPTDIVFLDPAHELLRGVQWKTGPHVSSFNAWPSDADRWKARGNDHFKAGHWLPSAFAYSFGLRCDPTSLVLRLNRSESYLRLKFFTAASADAHYVRCAAGVTDAYRDKALYREAKAEYERGHYQAAQTLFKQRRSSHPDDCDNADWIDRCGKRLQESKTGLYDWTLLFRQSQSDPHLDVAEYKGPIEVRQMPNRGGGRGIAATKDIRVGDLLVVEKPFSYASSNVEESGVFQMTINMAVYGNPDLHDRVFHLYAGPEYPAPPPTYPPRHVSDPVELDPLSPTQRIDIAKLESICTHNSFSPIPLQPNDPYEQASAPGIDSPTGLYTYTAMFNHSCSPNANYVFFGNVMTIRASQSIKAGEEVTIGYIPQLPYTERRRTLETSWHMTELCDCAQCQDDRVDGDANIRHREEILATISGGLLRRPLKDLQALQKKLSATYAPTRGPRRLAMFHIHHVIAEHLRMSYSKADMNRAIQEDILALECLGLTVLKDAAARRVPQSKSKQRRGDTELMVQADHVNCVPEEAISPMLRIAQTYLFFDDLTNIRGWLKTAQWVFNCGVGGGKELFLSVEEPTLKAFELLEFATTML